MYRGLCMPLRYAFPVDDSLTNWLLWRVQGTHKLLNIFCPYAFVLSQIYLSFLWCAKILFTRQIYYNTCKYLRSLFIAHFVCLLYSVFKQGEIRNTANIPKNFVIEMCEIRRSLLPFCLTEWALISWKQINVRSIYHIIIYNHRIQASYVMQYNTRHEFLFGIKRTRCLDRLIIGYIYKS